MSLVCEPLERGDWVRHDSVARYESPFVLSLWAADAIYGVFKGKELIASVPLRLSNGNPARYVEGTPWQGIVSHRDTLDQLAVGDVVTDRLCKDFSEVTLTLDPTWYDIRGFLWRGMRPHVRYTHRGLVFRSEQHRQYEKRLKIDSSLPVSFTPLDTIYEGRNDGGHDIAITLDRVSCGDSYGDFLCMGQYKCWYWDANRGGNHAEIIDRMIRRHYEIDLVGCNSPNRDLFKRAFGLPLRSYYAVTTSDERDLRAMPVPSLYRRPGSLPVVSKGYGSGVGETVGTAA